jgi:hypothetical protein
MADPQVCTRSKPNCQPKQLCFNEFGTIRGRERNDGIPSYLGMRRTRSSEKLEIDRMLAKE